MLRYAKGQLELNVYLVKCSSFLQMEAACSSRTPVTTYQGAQYQNPQDIMHIFNYICSSHCNKNSHYEFSGYHKHTLNIGYPKF